MIFVFLVCFLCDILHIAENKKYDQDGASTGDDLVNPGIL